MKKIVLFLFAFSILNLAAFELKSSFSIRNPREEDNPSDYSFCASFFKRNSADIEVEFERESGIKYQNLFIDLEHNYRFVKFGAKRVYNLSAEANLYQINCGVSYRGNSIGVAEIWTLHPETKLMLSKKYSKNLGINYILPLTIDFNSCALTSDLKNWEHEASIQVSASISALFSVYFKLREQYYSAFDWQSKIGISIKLMEKDKKDE